MNKLKLMTIVGTRPELIRLSRILAKFDKYYKHTLVHTGQNYDYELNQVFFDELGIKKPDFFLNTALNENSLGKILGNIISESDQVMRLVKPDALFVLGDTNSSLSVIAAKRLKIPIFHMEAGNRCFDFRVPEEINRRIVDHTADINLTYSKIAREYLLREGLPSDQIIKVGSPMYEVLEYYSKEINQSSILSKLNLTYGRFFLFSIHREENLESIVNFKKFINIVNKLAIKFKLPIIISTHPRTRKVISQHKVKFNSLVKLLKPLGFFDYIKLQLHAKIVLSDSGTITEESSILNFPALNLRDVTERPEGMEEAAVMMVGMNFDRIIQGISILSENKKDKIKISKIISDYDEQNVSEKIVRIVNSYIDYVNRVVWRK